MLCSVKWLLLFVCVAAAREISDEELHRLPRLFHLDDYDRCLSQRDGLYCLGTFELTPKREPNQAYNIMMEHNKQSFAFDRRLLHRGYCLSKRCQSNEKNTTLRFEQCAEKYVRKQSLIARLKKFSYCRTHDDRKVKLAAKPDLPQQMFSYAVHFILVMNVLGTLYDLFGFGKKNKFLLAWSIPGNWRSLTEIDDDGDTTFTPIQTSKVVLHAIIIYVHSNLAHYMSYVYNPEDMENARQSFVNVIIMNGTSLVQIFILISSFFTGYNVLATAKRSAITAKVVCKWIVKRIFRIAPVYLLLVSYSATWWPRYGDGPQWTPLVEAESQICRNKFWTHLLFINNFVNAYDLCMVQSWAMAAEVQLFLTSLFLTILLSRLRVRAVPVLAAMFGASCLFNITLAYFAELVPMVKIIVPEKLRVEFHGSKSFFHLHMSPWSNLPACLFGLLVAHIYFEQKNKKDKKKEEVTAKANSVTLNAIVQYENVKNEAEKGVINENGMIKIENKVDDKSDETAGDQNGVVKKENGVLRPENGLIHRKVDPEVKSYSVQNGCSTSNGSSSQVEKMKDEKRNARKAPFLLRYAHCFTFPTLIWWVVAGARVVEVESKPVIALYVGLERLMFSLTFAVQLWQVITVKGPWAKLMTWRGWIVPARLALSVAMVHWCVNMTIVASRPVPVNSSLLYVSMDWIATMVYSYVLAIPLCVLVELPMKKFGDALVS